MWITSLFSLSISLSLSSHFSLTLFPLLESQMLNYPERDLTLTRGSIWLWQPEDISWLRFIWTGERRASCFSLKTDIIFATKGILLAIPSRSPFTAEEKQVAILLFLSSSFWILMLIFRKRDDDKCWILSIITWCIIFVTETLFKIGFMMGSRMNETFYLQKTYKTFFVNVDKCFERC